MQRIADEHEAEQLPQLLQAIALSRRDRDAGTSRQMLNQRAQLERLWADVEDLVITAARVALRARPGRRAVPPPPGRMDAPLPPDGPVTVVLAWPGFGMPESRTTLDAAAILAAAVHSQRLWPPQPATESPEPPPARRPSSGWFAYGTS